ncbi:MAG: glycosyltransferase family 2 protein [Rhodobacteraceae bacterium]|nr:glycosyltransferase family 2 protein [Paracoccaceae bacterium]
MPEPLTPTAPLVSIVVPCFNEQDVIAATFARLEDMAARTPPYRFEFVLVDDGSRDDTLALLRAQARRDDRVRVIGLARNFGHQIAATAGIDAAAGDCVVLLDADLQDPPEVIAAMLEKWREGHDVVYGTRINRHGETAFKRWSAKLFYRVLNRLSDVDIPLDTGDFRLMSRPVVEVLKAMPERHRFLRGMVAWAGFRQIGLPYERAPRHGGTSKYPLRKMLRFAADGILSFSSRPLKIATGLGMIASALGLLGIVYALFMRVFSSEWVEGWTALMIAVLFMGGVQLISVGVMGAYIGRLYEESKRRPLYVVAERIGGPVPQDLPGAGTRLDGGAA